MYLTQTFENLNLLHRQDKLHKSDTFCERWNNFYPSDYYYYYYFLKLIKNNQRTDKNCSQNMTISFLKWSDFNEVKQKHLKNTAGT